MAKQVKSDYDILKEHHRFIYSEEDRRDPSWEAEQARKYDNKLRKGFAICDLSQYKRGQLGLRWRTEREAISGKGEIVCAAKGCPSRQHLGHFEVYFKYSESGVKKDVLVTVVLCDECARKLKVYRERKKKSDERDRDGRISASSGKNEETSRSALKDEPEHEKTQPRSRSRSR